MPHVVRHLVLASLVALVAAGFVAPVAASAATVSVRITDRLSPAELTVPAGTTIRFVNADDERHRMRSQSGPAEFDSHNLEPGQTYSMKLTAKGTYTYLDEREDDDTRYHGRIVVGGTSSSTTKPSSGGGSTSTTPKSASVSMAGRAFGPGTVTIAAGGSVTFRNDDDRAHTVTARRRCVRQRPDRRRRVVEADVQAGRLVLVPVRDPSRDDGQGGREGHGRVGWLGG